MRSTGEVVLKRLQASHSIKRGRAQSGQGATLQVLLARGCVGLKVAYKKAGFRNPEIVA